MNIESISESYFNQLTFVSETLSRFVEEIKDTPEIYDVIVNSEYGKVFADISHWDIDPISTALLLDATNCYRFLGHPVSASSPEGLGLALLDHYIVDPEYGSVEYSDLPNDDYLQQHAQKTFSWIENSPLTKEWYKKNDLLLGFMLSLVDKHYAERYVLRLYRFFEAVANVDNEISESESEWLKNFKPFKDKYVADNKD